MRQKSGWLGKTLRSPWARASDALDRRSERKFHARRVARLVRRLDFAASQESGHIAAIASAGPWMGGETACARKARRELHDQRPGGSVDKAGVTPTLSAIEYFAPVSVVLSESVLKLKWRDLR